MHLGKLSLHRWILMLFNAMPMLRLTFQAPAYPLPFSVTQGNGEEINVRLKGNEHSHWFEDSDGYTLIKHQDGNYMYAMLSEERNLVPSEWIAGQHAHLKRNLPKGLRPEKSSHWNFNANPRKLVSITQGKVKNLVIPFVFSDHTDRDLPSSEDLDLLFNAPGGHPTWANHANMSIQEYFQINSYGKLTLESDVIDWIQLDQTEADVTLGASGIDTEEATLALIEALHDVLAAADLMVDFSDYDQDGDGNIDAITFLHSGYGAEWGTTDLFGTEMEWRVWSHKYALVEQCVYGLCLDEFESEEGVLVSHYHLSSAFYGRKSTDITTIATAAHETLHFFGLPDLYDRDGSSSGIGNWGIMSSHYGWDNDAKYPPYMSAWSKYNLSWVDAVPLHLQDEGVYKVSASLLSDSVYMIEENFPTGEYLMIENRQPIGLERNMPQGGLVIWHIASDIMGLGQWNDIEGFDGQFGWPSNGKHYSVAVVQADGNFDLERDNNYGDSGDAFHADGVAQLINQEEYPNTFGYRDGNIIDTGIRITNISDSDLDMTFNLTFVFDVEDSDDVTDEETISGVVRVMANFGYISIIMLCFSAFRLSFI